MKENKVRRHGPTGLLALLAALLGVALCATPAKAAAGGDAFTVVCHIVIDLKSPIETSTISGPSVGGTRTFKEVNQMFADAGGEGDFITYNSDGSVIADFSHAAVKDTVNSQDVYFNLGHMLLGDPYGSLFQNGNAITVTGSGSITFRNLDVSILPNSAGSGTNGTDTTEGGNISHGLLQNTNTILNVASGCNVTLGEGVDFSTDTPASDNGGKTVACGAIIASDGGNIDLNTSSAGQSVPVIDGRASTTGTGKITITKGLVTNVASGDSVSGTGLINATVGNQTIMGSSPMDLSGVVAAGETVTITSAPEGASVIVPASATVKNSSNQTITYGNGATTNTLAPSASGTAQQLTPQEKLRLLVANTEASYPATAASIYTSGSWAALQTALSSAKAVLADVGESEAQITSATNTLQTAVNGLIVMTASMQQLQAAVIDAAKVASKPQGANDTQWSAFQKALTAAQDALNDPGSYTSAQLNGLRGTLQNAAKAMGVTLGGSGNVTNGTPNAPKAGYVGWNGKEVGTPAELMSAILAAQSGAKFSVALPASGGAVTFQASAPVPAGVTVEGAILGFPESAGEGSVSTSYDPGTELFTLTATAATTDYKFASWTSGTTVASTVSPWTVGVAAAKASSLAMAPAGIYMATFESAKPELVPVYRLYNPYEQFHLYTTSLEEYESLHQKGWNQEDIAWYSTPTLEEGGVKVQRYYNPYNGDHYFSGDPTEQADLESRGWEPDSQFFYGSPENANAIQTFWNPWNKVDTHMWTTDPVEAADLDQRGWVLNDLVYYAAALPN